MVRAVCMAALALYVAIATGDAPVLGTPCTSQCADDDTDGRCGPTCNDCACCAHSRIDAPPACPGPTVPLVTSRTLQRTPLAPPAPEPAEILHVPIA